MMLFIINVVGIVLLVLLLYGFTYIFLKELALKKAGNIVARITNKKIDGIYENGIIKSNIFTDWKNIRYYHYFFRHEIIFVKHRNNKEIIIKFNVGDFDNIFKLLKTQGLYCIDPSS